MARSTDPGLETLLARAAAFGTVSQTNWATTPEEALGFVIDAVRTCVLPRDLTVLADGRPRLRLIASGGHLLQVLRSPGIEMHPAASGLIGRPLDATTQADLDALADLLQGLFPGGEGLCATTAAPSVTPDPMSPGIACPAILARLDLLPFDGAVPDPLGYFIAAAEEVLLAVLRPGAQPDLRDAGIPIPEALIDQAHRLMARSDGALRLLDKDRLLCLHPADAGPLALVLACNDGTPLALIVEADATAELAGLWASMRHGMVLCET